MKNTLLILAIIVSITLHAQVKLGQNAQQINASAIFELEDTAHGFLPPRMTLQQLSLIPFPAAGLIVYVTNGSNPGLYYNAGTGGIAMFKQLIPTDGQYWTKTPYYNSLSHSTFPVGIGTIDPKARLHIYHNDSNVLGLQNSTPLANATAVDLSFKNGSYFTGLIRTRGFSSNTAALSFFTYASQNLADMKESMTILDNGNVGIGNVAPVYKLDVAGALHTTLGATIGGGISGFSGSITNNLSAGSFNTTGNAGIGGSLTAASASFSGNMGSATIGTSGNAYIGGSISAASASVTNNIGAATLNTTGSATIGGALSASTATISNTLTAATVNSTGNASVGASLTVGSTAIVNGVLQMKGGNPGAGKILTSSATGVASWQSPGSAHPGLFSCAPSETLCPSNAGTTIPFFGAGGCSGDFDDAGGFDNANNRYIAQQTGFYHFDVIVLLDAYANHIAANDGQILLSLEKVTPSVSQGILQHLDYLKAGEYTRRTISLSGTIKLNQGDYIYVALLNYTGVTVNAAGAETRIMGFRVY